MAGFAGTEQERLALRAFVRLVRTANALSARLHRPLAEVGLTESQFGVLEAILHLGPLAHREAGEEDPPIARQRDPGRRSAGEARPGAS